MSRFFLFTDHFKDNGKAEKDYTYPQFKDLTFIYRVSTS